MIGLKNRYCHVPISLIRNFVTDTENTILEIIKYGCYTYSKTGVVNEMGEDYFLGQFIYALENEQKNIPESLKNTFYPNQNSFDAEGYFIPDVESLKDFLKDDEDLKNEILDFCKFRYACNFYGDTDDMATAYEWCKETETTIPEKTATVMVNYLSLIKMLDKTIREKDKMRYAVYMGVCSIIGKKKFILTNRDLIFARALGYHSVNEVTADNPILWQKYNTRRRIITFLENLEEEKRVVFYTAKTIRGIYVGYFNKITFTDMVKDVLTKKKDNNKEQRRLAKKEIEKRILKELKDDE